MKIDVRQFIQDNYTEYTGDASFLQPPTQRTKALWEKCCNLLKLEKENGGVLDIEASTFSGITNFAPGYIDKENEIIFGLQADAPLKRIINPYGGMRMVESSLKAYNKEIDNNLKKYFTEFRKTHNQGVFDAYTPEIRAVRHTGLITGLPDSYGRGRIIGDYRRVALYGIDELISQKQNDLLSLVNEDMTNDIIQLREEVMEQIKALYKIKELANSYNYDVSNPATTCKEALQHIYFAYLAGSKENNGAATSLGRISTFVDIYAERDLKNGNATESEIQELVDQFVMKLRLIRHLRTPAYDELFAGDPTWITESIGGIGTDGRALVTKMSYRFLQTLYNLGPAPEPNLTILWDEQLPKPFKEFCAKVSIDTNAIQYENDSLMRETHGDDYGIACCVSAMTLGKEMQFFGARCNVAKALLYAINGGRDEFTGEVIIPDIPLIDDTVLNYDKVMKNYQKVLQYTAKLYVQANNIIHYMHDKYAYEASQMALHDTNVNRLMAFGIAGFSVAIDSLAAIKYSKVIPIRNEEGIAIDFQIDGKYPQYGNNDDRADNLGIELVKNFYNYLIQYKTYRNAKHTLSILTITSNVVYGKKTGATPDGRPARAPFAPGANPMHGREHEGALASLHSVAKIPYHIICEDGISNTFSIVPQSLGKELIIQVNNLTSILDAYFSLGGHHLNVNVLNKEMLEDAIAHPENYSALTIRVSGYAVLFNSLTAEQKREILLRTFHEE